MRARSASHLKKAEASQNSHQLCQCTCATLNHVWLHVKLRTIHHQGGAHLIHPACASSWFPPDFIPCKLFTLKQLGCMVIHEGLQPQPDGKRLAWNNLHKVCDVGDSENIQASTIRCPILHNALRMLLTRVSVLVAPNIPFYT